MAFGKELKRLRAAANISVAELSSMWGISPHKIRKWEERDSDPQNTDKNTIEKVYGKTLDKIIDLDKLPNVEIVENDLLRDSGLSYLSKDDLIKSLRETVESQKKIIVFLEAENERLKILYESDQDSLRPIKLLKKATTKAT